MEGTPFGRYQLIELLGRGGMGEVWRAYDTAIDRVVALKMLLPHYAQDADFEQRFRREARAAARLDDPHVVAIHDVGEIDGRLYVTMRLINGVDLQTMLNGGPLEPDRAVHIVEQIASALNSAHQVGLVHRDVKPSNILVAQDDFAYLIDFGIARAAGDTGLTSAGAAIGTWAYMAPERFSAADIEPSSDVYALACVLYECLTGETPFPGSALEQIAVGHMINPPPKPSEHRDTVPTTLDQVIATGLAKQPTDRYPSAIEMATAAREAITDPTGRPQIPRPGVAARTDPTLTKPPPGSAPSFRKRPWRRPGLLVGALVAVILLVAGGVFAVLRFSQHHNPAPAAPATVPFAGVYTADFSAITDMAGKPEPGAQPQTSTWGVRSVCRPAGCVATASRLTGVSLTVGDLVFDQIDGRWVAVDRSSGQCGDATAEVWEVFTLQPHPDGTLSGEYTEATTKGCHGKLTITFTRTKDIDLDALTDPATLPPRTASPAQALHGRYHEVMTYLTGQPSDEFDFAVTTDCLRTGDRCMSYFYAPTKAQPLVFGDGKWVWESQGDDQCANGAGQTHITQRAEFPLPKLRQDPIPLLTGNGHTQQSEPCPINTDIQQIFTRTGD